MPLNTHLTRSVGGVLKALDLSGVADGTELTGYDHWRVYANGTSNVSGIGATGYYEIRGGEIRQKATTVAQLALWGHADVASPGQCVVAEAFSTNWAAETPGLAANATLNHASDIRLLTYNSYELRARSGTTNDYGAGFAISTGAMPGQPLTNGAWYSFKLGAVQVNATTSPRGASAINTTVITAENTLSTGVATGDTYPGLISWASSATATKYRNFYVTRDYRLRVRGLTGTQGFRLYAADNSVLKSSAAQSGAEASVNLIDLAWPLTGYLQVFDDAGTWATPSTDGRWPQSSTDAAIYGGDIIERPTLSTAIQINWDDTASWPAFWTDPATKDVTLDVTDCLIEREAANPSVGRDTLTLTLRDPHRIYVPAGGGSPLYPNVRLNRKTRVVIANGDDIYCLFYGYIASYKPQSQFGEKATVVRAESPLRALANDQRRPTITATVVSVDNTTGAVAQVLDVIDDTVPELNRDLDAAPDPVPEDMQQQWGSPAAALEQLAILTDSLYSAQPRYRTITSEPDWVLRWQYRDAKVAAAADWTWDAATTGFVWDVEYSDDG